MGIVKATTDLGTRRLQWRRWQHLCCFFFDANDLGSNPPFDELFSLTFKISNHIRKAFIFNKN